MVHPTDKGSKVTEGTFYLTSMGELELLVNVCRVFDWPIVVGPLVDARAVGPELRARLDLLEQEAVGLQPSGTRLVDEIIGQLLAAGRLSHSSASRPGPACPESAASSTRAAATTGRAVTEDYSARYTIAD